MRKGLSFVLVVLSAVLANAAPAVYVAPNGNVGVGNNNPQQKLDVTGALQVGTGQVQINSTAGDNFYIRTKTSTPNPNFAIAIGDGANGTTHTPIAWNHMLILNGSGNAWVPSGGNPLGSQYRADMIINSAGNVGIGTVSPSKKLEINGDIKVSSGRFYSAQRDNFFLALQNDRNMVLYDGGPVWWTGTVVSDIRTKENILPIRPVLDTIHQISVIEFNYKPGVYDNKKHIGFIAQEIEKLYPDFVYTDPQSGRKLVDYNKMSTIAIEAVKELKAQNAYLAEENKELKRRIAQIEKKLGM